MNAMRIRDVLPQVLADELLRLYREDPHWTRVKLMPNGLYDCECVLPTWSRRFWHGGADALAMKASSWWLGTGPKVFLPTAEQCKALENVKVNVPPAEFSMPYPALVVMLNYPPFTNVLCWKEPGEPCLVFVLGSEDHAHDITTAVSTNFVTVEDALTKFHDDCIKDREAAVPTLRVAVNSCLALSHFGSHLDYLLPKEVANDRFLAMKGGERGVRARQRLDLAFKVCRFDREVKLHRSEGGRSKREGEPSYFLEPHWRSGHWAMQPYGPETLNPETGKMAPSLRKRIYRAPTFVRPDLFVGELSDTRTVIKG